MVRAPCCEKMGLKKGPWTPEEDQILINYIQLYGHGNWRALPKQAGLLRCGKSCRLRWTNYLRPDIKRGNFTREEEDTIINLHQMHGNRWSLIAARLPGRTDNEIKNVWHTHLKKRLKQEHASPESILSRHKTNEAKYSENPKDEEVAESVNLRGDVKSENLEDMQFSPPHCSSDISSVTTDENYNNNNKIMNGKIDLSANLPEMDESFWSEVLSADNSDIASDFPGLDHNQPQQVLHDMEDDNMDFWYNVFTRAGELPELQQIL